jgi:hypothetical protein
MCLPFCLTDGECALNEKCLKGNCICKINILNFDIHCNLTSSLVTCRVDNDCFLGHICLNNMCLFGCRGEEDCSASESCRANRCVNPCSEAVCGPNAVCSIINQRAICSCLSDFIPNPSPQVACSRRPIPCTQNRGCPDGASCVGEVCKPVCFADSNCLSNERCSEGVCKPLCRKADDCRSGEICEGLVCVAGCYSDSECPSNRACVNNKCISKLLLLFIII